MKVITFLFIACICGTEYPQVTQKWLARYDGIQHGYDMIYDLTVDNSGNVYVTGSSQKSGAGQDYQTIKYNSEGIVQWTASYNDILNLHDQAYSIAVDNSGNVYVTGGSFGNGTERDYLTIKYNSEGDTLWTRRYNGPGFDLDEAIAIVLDDSNNVYITGYSENADNLDYFTIKYDSTGNQIWGARYIGDGNISENRPHDLVIDGNGYIYVTGESSSSLGSPNLDSYATIKYDQSGDTVWTARYHGPGVNGLSQASALALDDSGNVYVTGRSDPSSAFGLNFDIVTVKYNSDGDELWVDRYNGPGNSSDAGNDVALDPHGNIIVTGFSVGTSSADLFTIKYTPQGDTIWTARYSEPTGQNLANKLAIDEAGNIYVTGFSRGISSFRDFVTIKYNSSGMVQWIETYNGPGNGDDESLLICLDQSDNIYIAGSSTGSGTNLDFAIIKYVPDVVNINEAILSVNEFALGQNYPNPFNPTTTIRFAIPESGNVKLKVYNIIGQQVAELVNGYKEAGVHTINFNAKNLNTGIYIYKLVANGLVQSKKMMLVK